MGKYLDIEHTRFYLRKAGVVFNKSDKISCNGDLSTLEGSIQVFGGHGGQTDFRIENYDNCTAVTTRDRFGKRVLRIIDE